VITQRRPSRVKEVNIMPTVQEEINGIKAILARFEKIGTLDEKVVLNDLKIKVDEIMAKLDGIVMQIASIPAAKVDWPYTFPQITWMDKTQSRGAFTINDIGYTVSKSG